MKHLKVATAISIGLGTSALAGGVERTNQSVGVIFEKGRYLELGAVYASPSVSGTGGFLTPGAPSGNITENYWGISAAFKDDINDNLSYAIIFDQPFGADITYPTSPYFFNGTSASLDTNTLTGVLRYKFDNNFSVYGGARVQAMDAEANIPFASGYNVSADRDVGFGYLVGAAYEKPELALRVALTYNSEIKHDLDTAEQFNPGPGGSTVTSIDTPQSVNLEFQTGLNPRTLLFGSVRWTEWSDFQIAPPVFTAGVGTPLVSYDDDRWTYSLGLGRKINDQWSVFGALAYERSTGSPTGNLSPTDGFTRYTVGASRTKGNMKITGAISYIDIGGATTRLQGVTGAGNFSGNDGFGVGVKVGLNF